MVRSFNILLLVVVILQLSCHRRSSEKDALDEAGKLYIEYLTTRDTVYLRKSYEQIHLSKQFTENGLTKPNYNLVSSVLMYLRKYDELEGLIMKSDSVVKEKEVALNIIRALKTYKVDSSAAYQYIKDNIKMIEERLKANPEDSLYYSDYFVMRIYLVGRKQALSEVDSFERTDDRFSHKFHEYVLRDIVEEYPEEYLFVQN